MWYNQEEIGSGFFQINKVIQKVKLGTNHNMENSINLEWNHSDVTQV
jgi:hypothetical protein